MVYLPTKSNSENPTCEKERNKEKKLLKNQPQVQKKPTL